MVSFHVLLLDRAGNNLVNADFSLYLGHIFDVKHIYLTLYIAYTYHVAPIYSAPLYLLAALFTAFTCSLSVLLALLFTSSGPIGSSRSPSVWPCCSLAVWPRARARCAVHLLAYVLAAPASVLYRLGDCYIFNDMSPGLFFTCARCACPCVRLLMPGQRWTF